MLSARRVAEAEGVSDRCLFVVAAVENLPFADLTFGAAAGIAVLEHVPDDRAAIAELARVMRPAGRVYFTVPNSLDGAPLMLRPVYRRHDRSVGHLRHYTAADLEGRCSEAGLETTTVLYTVHWEKVVQLGVHLALGRVGIADDRLWWWLEGLDSRHGSRADGLHLHLLLEKAGTPEP
jgi:SAM-dependent methyltransferase